MGYTFNEQMERLHGYAKGYAKDAYLWRNLLCALAIASIALPWARLDGQPSSHSGADLIIHLFTGTERIQMLKQSPLGFLALFLTPIAALLIALAAFWKVWNEREPLMSHLLLLALPLPMLLFAGGLTSTQHQAFGGRMAPQAGVILLMGTQLALVAIALYRDVARRKRRAGRIQPAAPRSQAPPHEPVYARMVPAEPEERRTAPSQQDAPQERERPAPAPPGAAPPEPEHRQPRHSGAPKIRRASKSRRQQVKRI